MGEVKWIKVATDMFESNRKIKQIELMPEGDTILVIWLKLLLLAGNVNDGGCVYLTPEIPYTDEMLANEFRRPLPTVRMALALFERFGMVEIIDDILHLSSWEKYQSTEKLAELREKNRLAQRKSRAKKKLLKDVNAMSYDSHMTSHNCHGIELEKDKDKNKESNTTTTTETRVGEGEPSVFEVAKYLEDTDPRFHTKSEAYTEASKFHAYNAMRGWDCLPDWQKAADLWLARIDDKKG